MGSKPQYALILAHDLIFSLVTDSMSPRSWRISTTCLFCGDSDGAGVGSRDGDAVEEEEARARKKALEEDEVERRKDLEGLGWERRKVLEAATAMATAAMRGYVGIWD